MSGFDDPRGRQGEQLAFEAEQAVRRGDSERARTLYERAAALEEQVVSDTPLSQPRVKSVLAVSAVALWLKARRFGRSQALARYYLSTTFPTDSDARELRTLVRTARIEEKVADAGAPSEEGESDARRNYIELLDAQAWHWLNDPSGQHIDAHVTDELESLWKTLSEADRNSIDRDTEALDTIDRTDEFSLQDNETEKLAEGPRALP